jgi:3-phenylpropionate/trans-cinnamate dioxygenase ferredoxin subunit
VAEYVIGSADDIPEGGKLLVEIEGRSIGVFRVNGRFYALRNRCPHQGGPLCDGPLVSWLSSPRPGIYEYDPDRPLIECPWHAWTFDLATGQSWFDPVRTRVKPYPVAVRDGVEEPLATETPATRVPGPYRAEVLPVSVKRRMLVVEVGS